MSRAITLTLATGCLVASSGCAAPLFLEKYGTAAPKLRGLAGAKIYLPPVTDANDVETTWKKSEPAEVEYDYVAPSAEQRAERQRLRDERAANTQQDALIKVGWQRNLYGMPIHDVRTTTPPAPWLHDAIAAELAAQGVELVAEESAAELKVTGTLSWLRVELFDTKNLWADLVVDVRMGKLGTEPQSLRIHTRGKTTAWTGSEEESYEAITRAEQQLEILLIAAIEERLNADCQCRCR